MQIFQLNEKVRSRVSLPLKRPGDGLGDSIPRGCIGQVVREGTFEGARVIEVLFQNPKYGALGTLYGVFPVQIEKF